MPQTLLTSRALEKITIASGSEGTPVAVTHIAIGDGNGSNYTPSREQTALIREQARVPIARRHIIEPNAWRATAEFSADLDPFQVREVGFFDEDGELVAVWAGLDVEPATTGSFTFIAEHILSFSNVEQGLIVVNAPDDGVFDLAVKTATALATMRLEQMRQADVLHKHFKTV